MRGFMLIALASVTVFAALLLWAAACDLASMEIPNRISIIMAGIYPFMALICHLSLAQIGLHLATGAGALVLCYILFSIGVFGGGDAKVLAAAAVWTGPAVFLPFLLCTAIAGGVLTAGIAGARAALRPADSRPSYMNRLLQPGGGIPYAIAIAAGGLGVLWHLPIWQHGAG